MRVRERDKDVGSERVVGIRVTRLQHWSGFFFLGYGYVTLVLLDDLCLMNLNLCWVFLF